MEEIHRKENTGCQWIRKERRECMWQEQMYSIHVPTLCVFFFFFHSFHCVLLIYLFYYKRGFRLLVSALSHDVPILLIMSIVDHLTPQWASMEFLWEAMGLAEPGWGRKIYLKWQYSQHGKALFSQSLFMKKLQLCQCEPGCIDESFLRHACCLMSLLGECWASLS